MSVGSSRAGLMQAHKKLLERLDATRPRWDDPSRKRFEIKFVAPLEKATVDAVRALDQLVGMMDTVRRECSEERAD